MDPADTSPRLLVLNIQAHYISSAEKMENKSEIPKLEIPKLEIPKLDVVVSYPESLCKGTTDLIDGKVSSSITGSKIS